MKYSVGFVHHAENKKRISWISHEIHVVYRGAYGRIPDIEIEISTSMVPEHFYPDLVLLI